MAQTAVIQRDLQGLAQTAKAETFQRSRVPLIDGGLRLDLAPVDLKPNEVPAILNLIQVAGTLQVDTGYIPFGTWLNGSPFGTVQKAFQFFVADGTSHEMLVTTATVYELNTTYAQWQLKGVASYTNTAQVNAGATVVALSSVAGLSNGRHLGLPLDDGEQLPVTITNISGSNVTFAPAIPAGRHVPNTSAIPLGIALNGNINTQVCIVPFPGKEWLIITNGIDPLFYFDGSGLVNLVTASDLPANTTCAWMLVWHESLFLFATVENGTALPQRVRMSDLANPLAWTPGAGSSIAAIYDLLDTSDFITTASTIGPYLIVYREASIMRGTYLGLLNQTVFWEYMVTNEGTESSGGAVQIGATNAFFGKSDIYNYSGAYELDSIGFGVFIGLFSASGDINPGAESTLVLAYVANYDELWVLYGTGASAVPNKLVRVNLEHTAWYVRMFANAVLSVSTYLAETSTTWAAAVGTWAAYPGTWGSRVFQGKAPVLLLCAPDTNQVYAYDYSNPTDAGTVVPWSVTTKDLAPGDEQYRWDTVRAYATGDGVLCEASLDGGDTFTIVGTFDFGDGFSQQILTFQAVSPYIRFRLSGSDPTFRLSWLEVWYLEESEW